MTQFETCVFEERGMSSMQVILVKGRYGIVFSLQFDGHTFSNFYLDLSRCTLSIVIEILLSFNRALKIPYQFASYVFPFWYISPYFELTKVRSCFLLYFLPIFFPFRTHLQTLIVLNIKTKPLQDGFKIKADFQLKSSKMFYKN